MNREELISICNDAIVPWNEWNDRDSFVCQQNVNQCHQLLKAGAEFNFSVNKDSISINFFNLNEEIIKNSFSFSLDYDDISLFKEENPDSEIFEYYNSVDYSDTEKSCYLPTRELLIKRNGSDWY